MRSITRVKVGDVLAKDGAWNRKYQVVAIGELQSDPPHPDYPNSRNHYRLVEIKFLGNFYTVTARNRPARKGLANREMKIYVYVGQDGKEGVFNIPYYTVTNFTLPA